MIVYISGVYRGHFRTIVDKTLQSLTAKYANVIFFTQDDDYVSFILENLNRIDIIHTHSCFAANLFRILDACKFSGIKILERGSAHIDLCHKLQNIDIDISDQLYEYDQATWLWLNSDWEIDSFKQYGFNNILKARYSIDIDIFNPDQSERIKQDFQIQFIGYDTKRKGLEYVQEALQNADFEYKLLINNVRSSNDYKNVSVSVLPSIEDGYPVACLEAMSSKIPVIISENNGIKEIIKHGENGFVVPIRDSNSILQYLKILSNDRPLVEKIGTMARQTILDHTWDDYTKEVLNNYERILS